MTGDELAAILQPIKEAGMPALHTGAAVMLASVLSGYRRLGRAVQDDVLRQIIAEAWRMHDAGCAVAAAETGLPMGLAPLKRPAVN